ncbi:transcription factor 21-like [Biomphalaria glabrata]|uniref:Transcription factor 21-like n=2 Tax=Biomphalaria glabrata TaxID=6526 RepID=A0A9W3AIF0_BIOGL|nr:transcription factor 21-like [Biomphalaria glabrata]KAI8754440.1 transcription factor 21 [Biomphalaria glabrata]
MPRKRKEEIERDIADGKIQKPQQRNAANARERSRMRVLSKAFSRLKTTLPWVPPDTKLSKLDTLRLASSYIAHLKQILDHEENMTSAGFIHPLNLTWPFTFNGRTFGSTLNSPPLGTRDSCHGDSSNSSMGDHSPQSDRNVMANHLGLSH